MSTPMPIAARYVPGVRRFFYHEEHKVDTKNMKVFGGVGMPRTGEGAVGVAIKELGHHLPVP
jgi:hypothetical protein